MPPLVCFGALILALLQAGASPAATVGRVQVAHGRGSLATPSGVQVLTPGDAIARIAARGHFELSVRGQAQLRWERVGSLDLRGPANVEWSCAPQGRSEATLLEFQDVHVELRRGPLLLHLPGGWRLLMEGGASHLALSPAGLDIEHDAGRPLLLLRPAPPDQVRPPVTLLPGARVRLSGAECKEWGDARRALDSFARADGGVEEERRVNGRWNGFAWPWKKLAPLAAPEMRESR